jgi:hypothetical protein
MYRVRKVRCQENYRVFNPDIIGIEFFCCDKKEAYDLCWHLNNSNNSKINKSYDEVIYDLDNNIITL